MKPYSYFMMQDDVIRYWCGKGEAIVELDTSWRGNTKSEPSYLSKMEELFGVTVKRVRKCTEYVSGATEVEHGNPECFFDVKIPKKTVTYVRFTGEKPVFATCPDCGTQFNTRRVEE